MDATRQGDHSRRSFLRRLAVGTAVFVLGGIGGLPRLIAQEVKKRRKIRLSEKALTTPLPKGSWLRKMRNFMKRSGRWKDLPRDPKPVRVRRPRVIGNKADAVEINFGVGMFDRCPMNLGCESKAVEYGCKKNNCGKQDIWDPDGDGSCKEHWCGENSCEGMARCDEQKCSDQESCDELDCGEHTPSVATALASEMKANWKHPFVKELRERFGVDSHRELAKAVDAFVGRNGYVVK